MVDFVAQIVSCLATESSLRLAPVGIYRPTRPPEICNFWNQGHPVLSLSQLWDQPVLQGAPVPSTGAQCLETKVWIVDGLLVTAAPLLLCPLVDRAQKYM